MPGSLWTNSFNQPAQSTFVTIVIKFKELEDLEKIIKMGFKEGFTAGLENLDAFLKNES